MPSPQQFQNRRASLSAQGPAVVGIRHPRIEIKMDQGQILGEFAQYIREAGGAEFSAQTKPDARGQSPAIDEAIFQRLDSNQNGKLEASEFGLTAALRKLDTDDDETISLAEFNPILFSPYASTLQQPTPGSDRIHDLTAMTSIGDVAKSLLRQYAEESGTSNRKHIRIETSRRGADRSAPFDCEQRRPARQQRAYGLGERSSYYI